MPCWDHKKADAIAPAFLRSPLSEPPAPPIHSPPGHRMNARPSTVILWRRNRHSSQFFGHRMNPTPPTVLLWHRQGVLLHHRLQIPNLPAVLLGVLDLATGALADVAADVDDEDLVGHIDLPLVHIV